ncbi:MAG: hypothetical protein IRZ16_20580 [Myxococcaceae bacterium]|nr:hypothetical protein [Myxococcaceae bacterium]
MSAKSRHQYVKGRRSGPPSEGMLHRHQKSFPKTGVRKHRKQRDIQYTSGGKRHTKKHPRA